METSNVNQAAVGSAATAKVAKVLVWGACTFEEQATSARLPQSDGGGDGIVCGDGGGGGNDADENDTELCGSTARSTTVLDIADSNVWGVAHLKHSKRFMKFRSPPGPAICAVEVELRTYSNRLFRGSMGSRWKPF